MQLFFITIFLIIIQHTTSNFTSTFFFGDSTLDTGNNKFITTPFKSNHIPYGLTFTNRTPTGRFSNGLLVPDLLTSSLNIKPLSPPYLDPNISMQDLKTGVNFASAGSGYDDETSQISNSVPMSKQLKMFEDYLKRLNKDVGEIERKRIVDGSLVLFSAGGNDFIFNYYDLPRRKIEFNVSGYQDFLQGILKDSVKSIYDHGVRNFIVAGLPPIGCLPIQISTSFKHLMTRKCIDDQISDTISYNLKLKNLLPELQRSLPGSRIAYLDITDNVLDIIRNPTRYGFEETRKGCCGTGYVEMGPLCNRMTPICKNISSHVFFDAIHPTEEVYKVVTQHILTNVMPELY